MNKYLEVMMAIVVIISSIVGIFAFLVNRGGQSSRSSQAAVENGSGVGTPQPATNTTVIPASSSKKQVQLAVENRGSSAVSIGQSGVPPDWGTISVPYDEDIKITATIFGSGTFAIDMTTQKGGSPLRYATNNTEPFPHIFIDGIDYGVGVSVSSYSSAYFGPVVIARPTNWSSVTGQADLVTLRIK